MFLFTNRNFIEGQQGFKQFGDRVNPMGPNELRVVQAVKKSGKWSVELLDETKVSLSASERTRLGLSPQEPALPSHRAALDTVDEAVKQQRNLVVFIHGYSNSMEDVVNRCEELTKNYGVEVLAFSWPTDSGGLPMPRYKSDKMDARASAGAVERTLNKLKVCWSKLLANKPDTRVTLFLHSMGAYLYENLMRVGDPSGHAFLFDNIVMVAPDCNSKDHATWIDKIKVKSRVFVCINERDQALRISEDMHGSDQLERLGQHLLELNSKRAHYINFTDAPRVRSLHSYFEGQPLKNKHVKSFFKSAFNGDLAENTIKDYIPHFNYYRVQRFNENSDS